MQTFLPMPNFRESVRILDQKRLGKQRVETFQIMRALLTGQGWIHHPATLMWAGYEGALFAYQLATCEEWLSRGYKDTCLLKTAEVYSQHRGYELRESLPHWFGDEAFHISHQSKLVWKEPDHYRQYFPDVPDDLEYVWPSKLGEQ